MFVLCPSYVLQNADYSDTSLPSLHAVRLRQPSPRPRLMQATTLNSEPPDFGENCIHSVEKKNMDTTDSNYIYIHEQEPELLNLMRLRAASEKCDIPTGKTSRMSGRFFPLQITPPAQESRAKLANI